MMFGIMRCLRVGTVVVVVLEMVLETRVLLECSQQLVSLLIGGDCMLSRGSVKVKVKKVKVIIKV